MQSMGVQIGSLDPQPQAVTGGDATRPRPLVRASLHMQLITTLREMIQLGELSPGAVISERDICARFGVSRTPLREALKMLATENLVQLRPHRAPLVTNVDATETDEIFELLAVIEPAAAELACQRATDMEIDTLSVMHEQMEGLYRARERTLYFSLNLAVHREIVRMSRNTVMLATYESLQARVSRARSIANLDRNRWSDSNTEHGRLTEGFRARDHVAVRAILLEHTRRTAAAVLSSLASL